MPLMYFQRSISARALGLCLRSLPVPSTASRRRSACCGRCWHAGPPGRRHLRAVPPLLRVPPRTTPRRAARSARCAACSRSVLRHARGRRDPRRRGHRPRHRVVPQRPLARLQDRRGHRPGAAARSSSLLEERPGGRWASRSGPWSSTRPTTRWRRGRPASRRPTRGSSRCCICTPDKDLAQCVVGDRVVQLDRRPRRSATRPACARSSACRPRRSPTAWRSWATAPTASPACPVGREDGSAAVLARYGRLEDVPRTAGLGRDGLGATKLAGRPAPGRPGHVQRLATLETSTWRLARSTTGAGPVHRRPGVMVRPAGRRHACASATRLAAGR